MSSRQSGAGSSPALSLGLQGLRSLGKSPSETCASVVGRLSLGSQWTRCRCAGFSIGVALAASAVASMLEGRL